MYTSETIVSHPDHLVILGLLNYSYAKKLQILSNEESDYVSNINGILYSTV